MWETASGWGPAVAGEPPQGESLPEEETPPHPTKLQCLGPAGQYAQGRQRGRSRGKLFSNPGVWWAPSDSLWGSAVIWSIGWSVFSAL